MTILAPSGLDAHTYGFGLFRSPVPHYRGGMSPEVLHRESEQTYRDDPSEYNLIQYLKASLRYSLWTLRDGGAFATAAQILDVDTTPSRPPTMLHRPPPSPEYCWWRGLCAYNRSVLLFGQPKEQWDRQEILDCLRMAEAMLASLPDATRLDSTTSYWHALTLLYRHKHQLHYRGPGTVPDASLARRAMELLHPKRHARLFYYARNEASAGWRDGPANVPRWGSWFGTTLFFRRRAELNIWKDLYREYPA